MKLIRMEEMEEGGVSHNARIGRRRILACGEVGPITHYARAVFPPGETAAAHMHHDMTEVFTVESGCGEIRIDGKSCVFSAGMTAVVEPGELHEIANTGTAELVLTYFGVRTDPSG